jgi:hypothetical protein
MADDIVAINIEVRGKKSVIDAEKALNTMKKQLLNVAIAQNKGTLAEGSLRKARVESQRALMKKGVTLGQATQASWQYVKALEAMTAEQLQFAKSQQAGSRGMNKFGMYAQQVGYQVGDFFVQVQSGTSALVAFGQQGTQLAGLLPGVYGAVVGIGLSIGTMLLKSLYDASGASKTFKERVDDSIEAMGKFKEAVTVATQSTAELINSFGVWGDVVRPLLEDITKLEQIKAFKVLNQQFDNLTIAGKSFGDYAREAMGGANQAVKVMAENLGLTVQQYYEIQKQIAGIRDLETNAERITAAAKIRDTLKATFGTLENMPDKMREFYRQLTLTVLTGAELEASMGKTGDQLETTVDKVQDLKRSYIELHFANRQAAADKKKADKDAIKAIQDAISLSRKELRNKADISELEAVYGSKSEQVAKKKAELARDAYEESLKEQGILGKNLKVEMAIYKNLTLYYNINKKITEEKDKQLKVSEKISASLVTMADAEYQMFLTYQAYGQSRIAGAKAKPPKAPEEPKGKEPTTMEGPIKALERQIELSEALFGLEGDARREQEVYMQLKFQNQDADIKAKESQLRSLSELVAEEERRTRVFEEQREVQKEVADTIANSMGDALTSIVDGTKSVSDAFKDMARAIIADLYQIYVVKQITGMISAAINPYLPQVPNANGNAFSGGNIVPYADGGVVSAPTMFPMNDGRTGLMGEAGPEAIMPLKRGKDGKLGVQAEGGAGDVIIHQNFNFQANGDESVKKIIAQQAPAIANMTRKQILDDRRRGGQMKQAFG